MRLKGSEHPSYQESHNKNIGKPHAPESSLEIRLFGGFTAAQGGKPLPPLRSKREQFLLALLVLRHDRDTAREWLATTLWPDTEETQALFYLRKALSNLRKALGDDAARLKSPTTRTVRLDMTGAPSDVLAFDTAIETNKLEDAVALYKGPLLPECLEDWAISERTQRENDYQTALEHLAKADSEKGDVASATRWLRLLIASDPYRETAYRALMQSLAESGDRAAITVVYRELQNRLLHDLNSNPSPETDALYKQLRHQERQTLLEPAHPAQNTKRHLPVPLTDLIGRDKEIKEILSWMKQRRMVTLVGAGGVGKTRLAIAIADAALYQFDDGVWFVDLAPLTDPGLIPQTAAKVLGIPEQQDRPLKQSIADAVCCRSLLLVFDNCEQFTAACAEFAHHLLTTCPTLYIVATSREALHIDGEQVLRVPSLPVPPTNQPPNGDPATATENQRPATGNQATESLDSYASIRLFLDRAIRIDSAFKLTEKNAPDIVEICRQLDGIPLAIEMAAARLRSLSVKEIKNRLTDRFRLLTTGGRGVLPRQQTLRAAIDWSYDHLSEPERALLRRLSVFSGGWTLRAAESISGQEDTFDLVSSLVEKSLALIEAKEEGTRYTMLETVKQYGAYRLAEAEERASVVARHRNYYLAVAEEAGAELRGPRQTEVKAMLEDEIENLRTAIASCLEDVGAAEVGLRIGRALWIFWADQGHMREGIETLEKLLARSADPTEARADALNGLGVLYFLRSNYPASSDKHEEAMEASEKLGYKKGMANALNGLGNSATDLADYDNAKRYYSQALAIQREIGNTPGIIASIVNLGRIANQQGDNQAARGLQEQALEICREAGDSIGVSRSLFHLGMIAFYECDFERARALADESLVLRRELGHTQGIADSLNVVSMSAYQLGDKVFARGAQEECLSIQQTLGNQWGIGAAFVNLGTIVQSAGELDYAKSLFRQAVELFIGIGDTRALTEGLNGLASVAREEGRNEYAAKLWGAGVALREANKSVLPGPEGEALEREMALAREQMGAEPFQQAFDSGHNAPLEEVVAYALSANSSDEARHRTGSVTRHPSP